jgi:phosphatidate cytidylyltransferase
MIARVLVICLSAFFMGGIGLYAASRRVEPAARRGRLIKFIVYFCIVGVVVAGAMVGPWVLSGMMLLIAALGAWEIYRVLPRASGGIQSLAWGIGAVYLSIATGAALFTWLSPPEESVFVFLVVCTFDGFSQVAGQMLGKHRLAPKISPGKTIEGSAGGLLAAAGMGLLLGPMAGWNGPKSLLVSCFIVAAALTGDLLASLVKRRGKIKDFSNLLPGHGGILDRFDSFLFAAAACFIAAEVTQWFELHGITHLTR